MLKTNNGPSTIYPIRMNLHWCKNPKLLLWICILHELTFKNASFWRWKLEMNRFQCKNLIVQFVKYLKSVLIVTIYCKNYRWNFWINSWHKCPSSISKKLSKCCWSGDWLRSCISSFWVISGLTVTLKMNLVDFRKETV